MKVRLHRVILDDEVDMVRLPEHEVIAGSPMPLIEATLTSDSDWPIITTETKSFTYTAVQLVVDGHNFLISVHRDENSKPIVEVG